MWDSNGKEGRQKVGSISLHDILYTLHYGAVKGVVPEEVGSTDCRKGPFLRNIPYLLLFHTSISEPAVTVDDYDIRAVSLIQFFLPRPFS